MLDRVNRRKKAELWHRDFVLFEGKDRRAHDRAPAVLLHHLVPAHRRLGRAQLYLLPDVRAHQDSLVNGRRPFMIGKLFVFKFANTFVVSTQSVGLDAPKQGRWTATTTRQGSRRR